MPIRIPVLAAFAIALLLHASPAATERLPRWIHAYREDLGNLRRYYDLTMDSADLQRLDDYHAEWQGRLGELEFGELSQPDQIDYLLLQQHLVFSRRQLQYRAERDEELETLIPFADTVNELARHRRRTEPVDARDTASVLDKLTKQINQMREDLDAAEKDAAPGAVLANRAVNRLHSLRRTLREWHEFYGNYDPTFFWWNDKPYKHLDESLETYADHLKTRFVGDDDTIVGDPIGRPALLDSLINEWIPYSPEELVEIARKEYAWCEQELKRASNELGFADDWRSALEHVKNLHVEPGEQPALIRSLAEEAVQFLRKHDLVSVPPICEETWRMEMMSPERQRVNPYFTGGEVISVSFPTGDMDYSDKIMSLRGNNIHFCRATVHHELIPGHHLQLYMAERHRPYRRLFNTPFLVEGWALHWEMLFWDMNFQRSAEDRMGMLFWRTHRCARIIFSLSFHLGKMSAHECVDYLVENVGHERRNATAEVRRSVMGNYSPLYQAAYMLGGLQMRALHRELVGSGKMKARDFHDAVLAENSIPIELIRASLTDQRLSKDFATQWRFYDPAPANGENAAAAR